MPDEKHGSGPVKFCRCLPERIHFTELKIVTFVALKWCGT